MLNKLNALLGAVVFTGIWLGLCLLICSVGLQHLGHQTTTRSAWPITLGLFSISMLWGFRVSSKGASVESWKSAQRKDADVRRESERSHHAHHHHDDLGSELLAFKVLLFIPSTAAAMFLAVFSSDEDESE